MIQLNATSRWTVIAVVFLCLAGCSGKPSSQDDPEFEMSDDQQPSAVAEAITGGSGEHSGGSTPSTYSGVMADGTDIALLGQDELTRLMARLEIEQQRVDNAAEQIALQEHRNFVVSRLLQHENIGNEVRYQATRAKLDALLRLSTLGREAASSELRSFASTVISDVDSRIAQVSSVAMLVTNVASYVRNADEDFDLVLNEAGQVLDRFSDSNDVFREVANMGEGLMRAGRRDEGLRWLKQLLEKSKNKSSEEIRQLADSVADRILVAEVDFDLIINEIQSDQPGAVARMQDVITQLMVNESLTEGVALRILRALNWLEEKDQREAVTNINTMMLESAEQIEDPSIRTLLTSDCEIRKRRLESLGSLFRFDAQNVRGQAVDWQPYHDRAILVAFWSTADPASMQLVRQLAPVCESIDAERLRFISVNACPDLDPMKTLFGNNFPEWEILVSATPSRYPVHTSIDYGIRSDRRQETHNDLADKFGVIDLPYLLVVDPQGQIVKTGIGPSEIKTELQAVLKAADRNQ